MSDGEINPFLPQSRQDTELEVNPFGNTGYSPNAFQGISETLGSMPSDRAGQVIHLSKKIGVPEDFVDNNFDFVKAEAAKKDFDPDAFVKSSPKLSSWMQQNAYRYPVFAPELSTWGKVEHSLGTLKAALSSGYNQNEKSLLYKSQRDKGYLNPIELKRLSELESESAYLEKRPGLSSLDYFAKTAGQTLGQAGLSAIGGSLARAGAASGGLFFGGPGGAVAAERVTSAGIAAMTFYKTYETETGSAYNDLRLGGIDHQTAYDVSAGVGTINAAIETGSDFLISGLLSSSFKKLAASYGGESMSALVKKALATPTTKQALVDASKKIAAGGATEGIEEFLQALVGSTGTATARSIQGGEFPEMKVSDELSSATREGLDAAVGSALTFGLLSAGTSIVADHKRIVDSQKRAEVLRELVNDRKESKIAQANPELAKEATNIMFQDDGDQFFLDVNALDEFALKQKLDPRAVAAQLAGDDGSLYDNAKERGEKMMVNAGEYINAAAGSEIGDFLINNASLGRGYLTVEESKKLTEEINTAIKLRKDELEGSETKRQAAVIGNAVRTELGKFGKFDSQFIEDMAQTYQMRAETRSRITGKSITELYNGSAVTFSAEDKDSVAVGDYGAIKYTNNIPSIVLGKKANATTITHESGHLFLNEMMSDYAHVSGLSEKTEEQKQFMKDFESTTAFFVKQNHKKAVREIQDLAERLDKDSAKNPGNKGARKLADQARQALDIIVSKGGADYLESSASKAFEDIHEDFRWAVITPYHEKFANGFNKRIGQGKSFPDKLRGAYNRFKYFILYHAGNLKSLDVTIDDEMAGVFDRLFTLDSTINKLSGDGMDMVASPEFYNLKGSEAEEFARAGNKARETQNEELFEKALVQGLRDRAKTTEELYNTALSDAKKKFHADKRYVAMYGIRDGKKPDGTDLDSFTKQSIGKMNRKMMVDAVGEEIASLLPRTLYEKNGKNPHNVAAFLGFSNVREMVDSLSGLPPMDRAIRADADDLYDYVTGNVLTDDKLAADALAAVYNKDRIAYLEREQAILWEQSPKTAAKAGAGLIRRPVKPKVLVDQYSRSIQGMQIKNIDSKSTARRASQARNDSAKKYKNRDIFGAYEDKNIEVRNAVLHDLEVKVEQQLDSFYNLVDRISKHKDKKSESRDNDYVNAIRASLSKLGLVSESVTGRAEDHLSSLKAYNPEVYERVASVFNMIDAKGFTSIEDMTVSEFNDYSSAISAVWQNSSSIKKFTLNGEKLELEKVKEEIKKQLSVHSKPVVPKIGASGKYFTQHRMLSMLASTRRMESVIDQLSLGDTDHSLHKYILKPVKKQIETFREDRVVHMKKLRALLKGVNKDFNTGPIVLNKPDGSQEIFTTKGDLIAALLHTGNISNLTKFLVGYNLASVDENGNLVGRELWDNFVAEQINKGVIKQKDMDFVQSVWDMNEGMFKDAQRVHKNLNGYYAQVVSPQSFTMFGKEYRGGYMPALIDPERSTNKTLLASQKMLDDANSAIMMPTTPSGSMKSRNEKVHEPLLISLSSIPIHIDSMLKYNHLQEVVKDVNKLLVDKSVVAHLDGAMTGVVREVILPWLGRVATQSSGPSDAPSSYWRGANNVMGKLRRNTSMIYLMGSVSNALQQLTGFFVASTKVKPTRMIGAIAQLAASPSDMTNLIYSKSKFMQQSIENENVYLNGEIAMDLYDSNILVRTNEFIKTNALFLQSLTQGTVNKAVWLASFNENIGKMSEEEAIYKADQDVILTQGTNAPESVSSVEAGSDAMKIMNMFWGYFNMLANLNQAEFHKTWKEQGIVRAGVKGVTTYFLTIALAGAVAELVMKGMSGEIDGDDDDGYLDDIYEAFKWGQLKTVARMFPPGANIVTSGVVSRMNESKFDDKLSMSPVVNALEKGLDVFGDVDKAVEKDTPKYRRKAVQSTLNTVTLLTGVGVAPLAKPINFVFNSEDVDKDLDLNTMRYFVSGKTGQEGKKK